MPSSGSDSDGRPPNVVLIFTDDQGYGDVGVFGSDIDTPNWDQMAAEGAKFTDFYVGASVCTPSRASLMTGCYSKRTGIREDGVFFPGAKRGLNPEEVTVADVLSGAGYATACIGKWHLGHHEEFLPTNQGFDQYYGIPYSNDMGAPSGFRATPLMRDTRVVEQPAEQSTLTKRYTEAAKDFISDHRDEPFFCYLPHTMPHVPLNVSDEFRGSSDHGLYGDVIRELDWSTGEILDHLADLGIDEDTLVIFTSDNGPWTRLDSDRHGSLGPLSGGKNSVTEGGFRVPTIMRWPGTIPAGETCSELATALDLLPTFANLAGADLPDDRVIDGEDITHLLENPSMAETPHDYFYYHRSDGHPHTDDIAAIRDAEGWKANLLRGTLYDLREDLRETEDLREDNQDKYDELASRAEAFGRELERTSRPVGKVETTPSPET